MKGLIDEMNNSSTVDNQSAHDHNKNSSAENKDKPSNYHQQNLSTTKKPLMNPLFIQNTFRKDTLRSFTSTLRTIHE